MKRLIYALFLVIVMASLSWGLPPSDIGSYSEVVNFWTQPCNGYLKNDGTCDTPSVGTADSVKSPATTGVSTFTGPAAGTTRNKTVRDADDTVLELGGSYAPTGTWNWTGATWQNVPTLNQNTSGSAGSVKSLASTGVSTFTGPAAGTTRAKTVRDADDTIMEQGGSYTPSGTWNMGSVTLTNMPTLNQNTSGTAAGLSGTPALPDGTTATTQSPMSKDTKLATDAYVDLPKTGQAVTCNDSGDANHGTVTITPTAGISRPIYLTNNDPHGCIPTMSKTGAIDGQVIVLTNVSANHFDFSTSEGVLVLLQGSPFAMAQNENLTIQYQTNQWVEIGRVSARLTGVVFGGFTASAGMVPLTDASGNLVNSYVAIAGPGTSLKTITFDDAAQTVAARNRDNTFTAANTIGDGGDDQRIVLNKNANDGTWSGITLLLTCHENVAFGQLVFVNSDGEAALADADAAATMPAAAINVVACTTGNPGTFLTHGTVTETDWNWTPGQKLYVSETAGGIENTVGNISDTNDVVQVIGVALTADTLLFMPSLNTIVLE